LKIKHQDEFHTNGLAFPVKEGDVVYYVVKKTNKGLSAVDITVRDYEKSQG